MRTVAGSAAVILACVRIVSAEPVTWTGAVGVTISGNSLTRGAAAPDWNSGASSVQVVRDGYGFFEYTADETDTARMCGFSNGDSSQSYVDIDFGFYAAMDGTVQIWEGGYPKGTYGSYSSGTRLRSEISSGVVRYYVDGTLVYTSANSPTFPLRVDCSMYSPGATITDVRIGNLIWTGAVGTSVADRTLTATGASGWNSGATSANLITGGDGFVEFTAGENTTSRAAGLGNDDTATTLADIEFAIHLRSDGFVTVSEAGTSRGDFGGYVGSDRFRVEVDDGTIRYIKNGVTFYTSATPATYPLRADTAFQTTGAVLQDVRVESLVWTSEVAVAVSGSSLTKTGTVGWNAGAASRNTLVSGDGSVEFTALETDTQRVVGLKSGGASTTWTEIDFAIELTSSGSVKVHEGGTLRGTFGSYGHTDRFRIEIQEGVVRYLQNGSLLYTSSVAPTYPLHADVSLYTPGATVDEVVMGDLVWTESQGQQVRGDVISKPGGSPGWDVGAVSTRAITEGYIEFVAGANTHARMLGLSSGNTNTDWSDIDFALYPNDVLFLHVFEHGQNRGHFGTYVPGDRLRVKVEAGVVTYWKNGTLIYTSSETPTLPLRADSAFYNPNAALFDVRLVGAAAPDQLAPPVLTPGAGTYASAQSVTMTAQAGATIRYTTDGSDPTASATAYTSALTVDTQTTLKARAFKAGWTDSAAASATYSFNYGTLSAPSLTTAGVYVTSVDVSMSAGDGTTIRYTTDGSEPTSASAPYSAPITLSVSTTIKAKAFKVDWTESPSATVAYTIKTAAPLLSLGGGTHAAGTPVTITLPTAGSTATYTINGLEPTASDVAIASGGTLIAGNYMLKVRARKAGCMDSDVASGTFTITGSLGPGAVTSGGNHSLAALPDGRVWSWGSNNSGELGIGTPSAEGRFQPMDVLGLTGVVKTAAGDAFSMALRSDGRVYTWGLNGAGQLGTGDLLTRSTPFLTPLAGVSAIAAGARHGLALKSDGSLWAWGDNTSGQLGDGTTTARTSPVQVTGIPGTIMAIASGAYHSLALTSEGRVWAWGLNTSYQLGDGTTTQRNEPVLVDGLFGIVAIGAGSGSFHSLAVRDGDGAVFAWGANTFGQLGDGTAVVRAAPVRVLGLDDVVSVGTHRDISTAVGTDGTFWAWGQAGAVGDGSTPSDPHRKSPVQLGVAGILHASSSNGASGAHSLALSNDGVIWSWTYNSHGQIGDGTGTIRLLPVRVTDSGFARKVATPTFDHSAGTWPSAFDVSLATATEGAAIRYTTDGSEPTTGSNLYTTPVPITENTTLKIKAFKSALAPSNAETVVYVVSLATPTYSPVPGTYTTPQNVTISTTTAGASIRYTTDGTVPTTSSTLFTGAIPVSQQTTLQAKAFHSSMGESAAGLATYSFSFPTGGAPGFDPGAGTFVTSVEVAITGPGGATLRYTTDGSDPTEASMAYATPLTFTATTTLKAKSFQSGQAPSATTTATYTIQLAAPTFSPSSGSLTPGQAVTLNHTDPAVTIRYTINGVNPTATDAAATPGSSVHPTANLTLKARAYKTGTNESAVTSGTFTISGTAGAAGVIAAGNTHAIVAKPDGTVWAWGQNTNGQLGDGTDTNRLTPTAVSGLSGITGLGGGIGHSAARKSDGTPWTTGINMSGQLGDGTNSARSTFGALAKPGGVDVVAVASGWNHTLALGSDGRVWAWGANDSGQLGIGNNTNQNAPVVVGGGLTGVQVTAIAAGVNHSLAVTSAGDVWAWGANAEGQLGDGSTTGSNVPVHVTTVTTANLSGAVDVAAGAWFSLARKSDGTVWSWGRNNEGQLGSGAISSNRTRADQVVQLAQAKDVAAGDWHALAVRDDGSVWAWGYGAYGQLGNASGSNQPTPVQAIGITGIDSVAAGGYFSLALGLDGSVWSWGSNSFGQLGDGTTESRALPGKVSESGFAWKVAKPSFDPPSASLGSPQNVTLNCATPGATIHYTLNGGDPTPSDPSVSPGGTILVDVSLTLKARAYKSSWNPSPVAAISYSLTLPAVVVSHASGTYHVPLAVTLTHPVPSTIIKYTLDGSEPNESSPTYTGGAALAIDESTFLKAKAYRLSTVLGGGGGGPHMALGPITSSDFTMKVGKPTWALGSCGCPWGVGVGVSTITPGAAVFGSIGAARLGTSTQSASSGAIWGIEKSTTLRTRGKKSGLWITSDSTSSSHFLSRGTAATPSFHQGPTASFGGSHLGISSSTPGSLIRFTLDGSEPTFFSPVFRGPMRVRNGMLFRARAFGSDYVHSLATSQFTVGSGDPPGLAKAVTFDPPGGTYTTTRSVTLTSVTSGATIHYTTDGSEPTTSSPSIASGGSITVSKGLPVKAIAVASGLDPSPVVRADYRITGMVVAGIHDSSNNVGSAMALKTDGTVWGWGNNAYGELGTGAGGVQQSPVQVTGLSNVKAIALGMSHGLAVKSDGTVWSWGQNTNGQLGDGSTTPRLTPAVVSGLSQVVSVAAGVGSSFALTSNGTVYSWGANHYGQLGTGDTDTQRTTPEALSLADVVSIAAGASHVLALKKDGTVWAWGYNAYGQLGDESSTSSSEPVQVHGLTGVTNVSAGGHQSFAVKSDGLASGQAWAWGYNQSNTLGDDLGVDSAVPVHILDDVRTIDTGNNYSTFFVKVDASGRSSLWGAGAHLAGMLRPAAATSTSYPSPVSAGSFVSVATGGHFRTALKTDSTLVNWGAWPAANGFVLGDSASANTDHDGDGLPTALEWDIGTDPWNADSNGDGIPDGATAAGDDPLQTDIDGDGLANEEERAMGTDPFRADTDGDGHPDGEDAYPLDPTRWDPPAPTGGDTTAPLVTLNEPTNATLVSVVPAP